jgi:hypothetical protein
LGTLGGKVAEERKNFILELTWSIQNSSGAHFIFRDSLAYQSTVEIKAAFTFLSLICLFLIAILTKKETVVYFPNSLVHQPN